MTALIAAAEIAIGIAELRQYDPPLKLN